MLDNIYKDTAIPLKAEQHNTRIKLFVFTSVSVYLLHCYFSIELGQTALRNVPTLFSPW